MRYFLVNGYAPSAHPSKERHDGISTTHFVRAKGETRQHRMRRYQAAGLAIPRLGETVILLAKRNGRISIFVHGAYDAVVLIAARSQRSAYLLGNALRAVLSCFHGHQPLEQANGYLLELSGYPNANMCGRDLAALINPDLRMGSLEDIGLQCDLRNGTVLDHAELIQACAVIQNAVRYPRLVQALQHLDHSRTLVSGFMVGSFYESHYRHERRSLSRSALQREYLENRFRYDSAFVSGFRGIECVLGNAHFKKNDIQGLLVEADATFGTAFATSRHRSWHEVFSSRRKWWKYGDLIGLYLKLRNAVSAHGNPSPQYIVMEDQVFEIQYLLQSMLADMLVPPGGARVKSRLTDR